MILTMINCKYSKNGLCTHEKSKAYKEPHLRKCLLLTFPNVKCLFHQPKEVKTMHTPENQNPNFKELREKEREELEAEAKKLGLQLIHGEPNYKLKCRIIEHKQKGK